MKVVNYLKKKDKTYFSFEILPPLKGHNIKGIYDKIIPLMEFSPLNINVTYHQEETIYKRHDSGLLEKKIIRKRPGTVAISAAIKYKFPKIITVPHIICGGFTKEDTEYALLDLHFLGIQNLLIVRGDPPKGQREFIPEPNGNIHSIDLINQIMNINKGIYLDDELQNTEAMDFSIGIAGYPEKHIEAPNKETDMYYLKKKIEAGAEYIVTQMFFDNDKYFQFVKDCRKEGINVPIVPGIKPIRNKRDLELIPMIFNIDVPNDLVKEINKCQNNKQVYQVGIDWAIQQSKELVAKKVPAVHYFTIGKSDNIKEIVKHVF